MESLKFGIWAIIMQGIFNNTEIGIIGIFANILFIIFLTLFTLKN